MKRWIFAILVVALGWSAFWLWEARALRHAYEGWAQDLRDTGWQVDQSALRIRGYPTRLDMTLRDPQLISPNGTEWRAPFVQILGLSYQPGHHIIVWPDDQNLTYQGARYQIRSDGLRASVVHDARGQILRANLEAQALTLTAPKQDITLNDLTVGAMMVDTRQYRIAAASQNTQLQAEISFDAPWTLRALHHPLPQSEQIDLKHASGWQALLDQALRAGVLTQALGESLQTYDLR